jgi:hypothetical protein
MATLAELWEVEAPAPVKSAKVSSQDQAMRDKDRMDILQSEMTKAQERLANGDVRAQGDIDALTREMGGKIAVTAPTAKITSSGLLADLWESIPAANQPLKLVGPEAIPTGGLTAPAPKPTVRQSVEKFFQAPISERVAGAVDTLYGVVPATYGAGVQALARLSNTPERAEQIGQAAAATIDKPLGKALGITGKEAYQQPLGGITEPIAKEINRMFNVLGMTPEQISEKTGVPASDIRNMAVIGGAAVPQALKEGAPIVKSVQAAAKPIRETEMAKAPIATAGSLGAAAVPTETTIKQALSVASPELQKALSSIPTNKVNVPTLQRHIEADSLPFPVRLTEGQATGDIVKLSNEQNRRGKDPQLAQRFNEQNGQLVENIGEIRQRAAPDVYGTKTIENSQGIIDAYKDIDGNLNKVINADYQALRDAAGGPFPVDAPQLLKNV